MTDHTHIVERLMALAVIAADIRAGDTAEFYVARRPVSEHNYKEALAVLRETLDAEITRLRDEAEALRKEAQKSERRAITFGDIMSQHISVMRAAVVAGHLESHAHGLQWIVNTLTGPGHLPDLDEARALGGAQALFDKEMAELDAFRAAHPVPDADIDATKGTT